VHYERILKKQDESEMEERLRKSFLKVDVELATNDG
jgi:hypothetical protein